MNNRKNKIRTFIRIIAISVIVCFTTQTIAWANPPAPNGSYTLGIDMVSGVDPLKGVDTLALKEAIGHEGQIMGTTMAVAGYLFEQGLPLKYLEQVLMKIAAKHGIELPESINLVRTLVDENGIINIPFTYDEIKYHIQVAEKRKFSEHELSGILLSETNKYWITIVHVASKPGTKTKKEIPADLKKHIFTRNGTEPAAETPKPEKDDKRSQKLDEKGNVRFVVIAATMVAVGVLFKTVRLFFKIYEVSHTEHSAMTKGSGFEEYLSLRSDLFLRAGLWGIAAVALWLYTLKREDIHKGTRGDSQPEQGKDKGPIQYSLTDVWNGFLDLLLIVEKIDPDVPKYKLIVNGEDNRIIDEKSIVTISLPSHARTIQVMNEEGDQLYAYCNFVGTDDIPKEGCASYGDMSKDNHIDIRVFKGERENEEPGFDVYLLFLSPEAALRQNKIHIKNALNYLIIQFRIDKKGPWVRNLKDILSGTGYLFILGVSNLKIMWEFFVLYMKSMGAKFIHLAGEDDEGAISGNIMDAWSKALILFVKQSAAVIVLLFLGVPSPVSSSWLFGIMVVSSIVLGIRSSMRGEVVEKEKGEDRFEDDDETGLLDIGKNRQVVKPVPDEQQSESRKGSGGELDDSFFGIFTRWFFTGSWSGGGRKGYGTHEGFRFTGKGLFMYYEKTVLVETDEEELPPGDENVIDVTPGNELEEPRVIALPAVPEKLLPAAKEEKVEKFKVTSEVEGFKPVFTEINSNRGITEDAVNRVIEFINGLDPELLEAAKMTGQIQKVNRMDATPKMRAGIDQVDEAIKQWREYSIKERKGEEIFPPETAKAIDEFEEASKYLEIDSVVATVIAFARMKGLSKDQKLLVALDLSWLPGAKDSVAHMYETPLISKIRNIDHIFKKMGLNNVQFITGHGNELAEKVSVRIAGDGKTAGIDPLNVVVLAHQDLKGNKKFSELQDPSGANHPFMAWIDPSNITKEKQSGQALDVDIFKILALVLELSISNDIDVTIFPENMVTGYNKDLREVTIMPRIVPVDIDELKVNHDARLRVFLSL